MYHFVIKIGSDAKTIIIKRDLDEILKTSTSRDIDCIKIIFDPKQDRQNEDRYSKSSYRSPSRFLA